MSLLFVGGPLAACGRDSTEPTIDYVIDADVRSYNANTENGNADGALMALTRVLPGFSFLGDAGQVTPDRDVGTVTRQPGGRLVLKYEFDPRATFSDGTALDCDDLVLAWAAMSGRFPQFAPASTAGYRDIDSVDCASGDKVATVTFASGRDYRDWAALFGAGTLLPAQVVARQAGVADIIDPIRTRDRTAIARIATAWNTGFDLVPGAVDKTRLPASGPYRVESYSATDGLVLVANDRWWGDKPATSRIAVFGRSSDAVKRLTDGGYDVADVSSGLGPDSGVPGGPPAGDPARALGVEGLVLSGRGVFGDVRVRRAFASCVPRDALARQFGAGAQMWNMRTLAPADELAAPLNPEFGAQYARPEPDRTRALLAEVAAEGAGGPGARTVRIGYAAPTPRWHQMIEAINASCAPAGLTVTDVGTATGGVGALGSAADALLVANGESFAAAGAADSTRDAYQLRGDDPLNLSNFSDPQVNRAIDDLAVTELESERLAQVRIIENGAWAQVPSIPLFAAPRVHRWNDRVGNVVAGAARNGTGWNMDRWVLK
ncbi:ABC transporter substrate-binding protein [Gordonia sp. DT30]|uniref:ABC transporter substrate-binding protein n=1 Tax=unclassified Gordonia (in: high G+C Gram-positive bacteria) TaxID=2657482 RepID=UPI003CED2767